ncbi:cAMP-independent regulatory protein pac2 [Grifola frondosa]|uniref:cAMP-independent regulatory protein pac2 n=1 Tax=Grifola frondosa TaxID=5627 RepID=A0A1C7M3F6_GRIFR|nr:cAMP-independent regulatory protein pac2 [Grifola frondosa]
MQKPTCCGMRVRSVQDAEKILHAVALGILPMITRRLDEGDRLALQSGCIYVWEERSSNPAEASGQEIQRFTEGRSWGPSRARDNFLLYYEKESTARSSILQRNTIMPMQQLIKQTYSVFIDSPQNSRKWHLNAYYTQESLDMLFTVDDFQHLKSIHVPSGLYVCARNNCARKPGRPGGRYAPVDADRYARPVSSTPPPPPSGSVSYPVPIPSALPPLSRIPPGRHLAPLEYLQNIPPIPRDPSDDDALRRLSSP